jgi:lipoate-protein ligase A
MPTIQLFPFEIADGATNMAADEWLLELAAAGNASLRFYAWSVPTLSLGYFQPEAVRRTDPSLAKLPYVRRSSGGATLVHHHELTYAIALPAGFAWQPKGQSWICRMHDIIAAALRTFGVAAQAVTCGGEQKIGDVLCFQHQTAGDLIVSGHKVAGSAQRKQRGALLQHGGILLQQSPHTPQLPGLRELTDVALSREDLCVAIRRAFQEQTQWDFREGAWTNRDCDRIRELVDQKYGSADWNVKR